MATFRNNPVVIAYPAENVYAKVSNPENLRGLLSTLPVDQIPEDKRAMLENIKVTSDSIEVPGGPVGSLTFKITEKIEPTLVKFAGVGAPVAMSLAVRITPEGSDACTAEVEIDLALPKMLLPMVSGPIQQMADQFGMLLKALPYA